jgi:hypothetical protein
MRTTSGLPSLAPTRSHARRFFHRLPRHEIRLGANAHLASPFSASKRMDGVASPTVRLNGKNVSFARRGIQAISAKLNAKRPSTPALAYACRFPRNRIPSHCACITSELETRSRGSSLVEESKSRPSSSRSSGQPRQGAPVHSCHRESPNSWVGDAVGHSAERIRPLPCDTRASHSAVLTDRR